MSAVIDHDTQQPVEPSTNTALAVVTKSIAEIDAIETTISELESKYKGVVYAVDTTEGMKEARKAREEIRETRYLLQNIGKAAKQPLNNLKRSIDDRIEGSVTRVGAIEDPVHQQIAGEEKRREDEKKVRIEAEANRVAGIQGNIEAMRSMVIDAGIEKAAGIAEMIAQLEAMTIDDTFAEFKQQAEGAKATTLVRLRMAHKAAVDHEAEQAKLAEERAKQAALTHIRYRISLIRNYALGLLKDTDEQLSDKLKAVTALSVDDSFGELRAEAEQVLSDTINAIVAMQKVREAAAAERARAAEAENARKARERATDDIRKIQDRVGLAAEGDTLEAYDIAISCTQNEKITAERFGDLVQSAELIKAETLKTLQQRRGLLAKRLAAEAELEEKRRSQVAEEKRLADERARLAQQEEVLKLQQETLAKPSDPAEALSGECVTLPVAAVATSSEFAFVKKPRPSDEAIVEVLMRAFSEDRATIVDWLCDLDLMALAEDEEPDFSEVALA